MKLFHCRAGGAVRRNRFTKLGLKFVDIRIKAL